MTKISTKNTKLKPAKKPEIRYRPPVKILERMEKFEQDKGFKPTLQITNAIDKYLESNGY